MVALGLAQLQEMAIGSTKGVGGIEELAHLLFLDMKHTTEHISDLLLARVTVARYRHLYLRWRILSNRHLPMNGSSNGNTLSTSKLQHTLDVLAEERRLDGHAIRQEALDEAANAFVYVPELEVRVGKLAQVDDAQSKHLCLLSVNSKYAVAHDTRARIYAKNDLLHLVSLPFNVQKYEINVKNASFPLKNL